MRHDGIGQPRHHSWDAGLETQAFTTSSHQNADHRSVSVDRTSTNITSGLSLHTKRLAVRTAKTACVLGALQEQDLKVSGPRFKARPKLEQGSSAETETREFSSVWHLRLSLPLAADPPPLPHVQMHLSLFLGNVH